MSRIDNIIVIGNWGAGKTQFIKRLTETLTHEKGIRDVRHDSDRLRFENAVRLDTKGSDVYDAEGNLMGAHSVLVKDGPRGQMKFFALDGSIFNKAHVDMIADLGKVKTPGTITLVEYATGPNTTFSGGEVLDQSAHFLVKTLEEKYVLPRTLVVELNASFKERKQRNKRREDRVADSAFDWYGRPGGAMTKRDAQKLGDHFMHIGNDGTRSLDEIVREAWAQMSPMLIRDNRPASPEGGYRTHGKER